MPRGARIFAAEGAFHILTRGNNKQMNNHIHLIIETNKMTELSKLWMRRKV